MLRFAKYHTGPPPSKVAGYVGGAAMSALG
jgi:hypothetical protein